MRQDVGYAIGTSRQVFYKHDFADDQEFEAVDADELAYALSLFVGVADSHLVSRRATNIDDESTEKAGEHFLHIFSTGKVSSADLLPSSSLTKSFLAVWNNYRQHPLQQAICARVLAFHFMTERTRGSVLKGWMEPCPSVPELVILHPAVVEALACIRLNFSEEIAPTMFTLTLKAIAESSAKWTEGSAQVVRLEQEGVEEPDGPYATKPVELASEQIINVLKHFVCALDLRLNFELKFQAGRSPDMWILFEGPDAKLLTANDGEMLTALEDLITAIRSDHRSYPVPCVVISPSNRHKVFSHFGHIA